MLLLSALLLAAVLCTLLLVVMRWRAPSRENTMVKAVVGFYLPVFLLSWSALAWLIPDGPARWGAIWLPSSIVALIVGWRLAYTRRLRPPRPREIRRARRRGELLDPAFVLYVLVVGFAILAAGVTRVVWASPA